MLPMATRRLRLPEFAALAYRGRLRNFSGPTLDRCRMSWQWHANGRITLGTWPGGVVLDAAWRGEVASRRFGCGRKRR